MIQLPLAAFSHGHCLWNDFILGSVLIVLFVVWKLIWVRVCGDERERAKKLIISSEFDCKVFFYVKIIEVFFFFFLIWNFFLFFVALNLLWLFIFVNYSIISNNSIGKDISWINKIKWEGKQWRYPDLSTCFGFSYRKLKNLLPQYFFLQKSQTLFWEFAFTILIEIKKKVE